MRQSFSKFKLSMLLCLSAFGIITITHGQVIPSGTVTASAVYNDPLGGPAIIQNGSVVVLNTPFTLTFMHGLTIDAGGILYINGATVFVAPGEKIILTQSTSTSATDLGAILYANNNATITSVGTPTATTGLWSGIECKDVPSIIEGSAFVGMMNATIENATCAYTQFDPNLGPVAGGFGRIYAQSVTFKDNTRCLDIGSTWYALDAPGGIIAWIGNYVNNCNFRLTNDYAGLATSMIPNDMINIENGGLVCHSSNFLAGSTAVAPDYEYKYALNTTAIQSFHSILWVEQSAGSPTGSYFTGFKNGIVAVEEPEGPKHGALICNNEFYCVDAININHNEYPFVVNNYTNGPLSTSTTSTWSSSDYCSIFLRNCNYFILEGNIMGYDLVPPYIHNAAGIVVMDCGAENNQVYRNSTFSAISVGIESIGRNREDDASTGLKILCNNLSSNAYDNNIAIMKGTLTNSSYGINNEQFIPSSPVDISAGNVFSGYFSGYTGTEHNYYLESSTNDLNDFVYKYNPAVVAEEPIYRSPFTPLTADENTCPVTYTRDPQPIMGAMPPTDKDGRPLYEILATGGKEKENQQGMKANGNNTVAMANIQAATNWLTQKGNKWNDMPSDIKQQVHETAENDATEAGAQARCMLVKHEGKKYDPIFFIPKEKKNISKLLAVSNCSIYPNPAKDKILVDWKGTTATLRILNILGQTSLTQVIEAGSTTIDISHLEAGNYLIQVQNGESQAYTQKLTVK